jgi:hypothetical protein
MSCWTFNRLRLRTCIVRVRTISAWLAH